MTILASLRAFPGVRFALGLTVLVGILMGLTATVASAHVPTTDGTSMIRQDGALVRYRLELDYDTLTQVAGLGKLPVETSEAEHQSFLKTGHEKVAAYVTERLAVELDGTRCAAKLDDTGIVKRQNFLYARLHLVYTCPSAANGQFTVRYGVFAESHAIGSDHINVVDYVLGGVGGSDVFEGGHRELRVGERGTAAAGAPESPDTGFLSSTARFVGLGLEHILLGIDHVLFLVLLLLGAKNWRSVIRLATAFTVAHSVTLALAVLGWVDVPSEIVEPLIAASIVYIAVENIVRGESRHRTLVVFAFGLLHGLGFAGALDFTDDFSGGLIVGLLSFNLGIELGQLLIVLLVFPLLLLARRQSWSSRAHLTTAAIVGVIGLFWLVERLLLSPGGAA
ncbi:HupE / UreJ protein [Actinokineospora alba]|uniref:HupE / UreJ protein n=1 Tax=Actinokineospora alba TaxID=504798 RepID=A0A1H0TPR2_9PSEU|nr:HupE/UreJ family protein [Actinokineospora alba]TDP70649.1 HupE/UreJ protein [Actinokineospora alba]SDJ12543.1 HupE / UreJ protein [Actinokineospora alba]SDP56047.1 HupE / UreJ protein [Actinokineospora alba]